LFEIIERLGIKELMNHQIEELSGGELQRFAISLSLIQKADVFLLDEFTSYLDIKQKIQTAKLIKEVMVKNNKTYIITTEHDLTIVDFLSDNICIVYGNSGAYGIVSLPYSVREGLNIFLSGFIPTENIIFRETVIDFSKFKTNVENSTETQVSLFNYNTLKKIFSNFTLTILPGKISKSDIVILLGENGTGKTTFIKILAGLIKLDEGELPNILVSVSYKPQKNFSRL